MTNQFTSYTGWFHRSGLLILLSLLIGCAAHRSQLQRALLADRNPSARTQNLTTVYQVGRPDVLDVQVGGLPSCSGRAVVGLDGRISLCNGVRVAVEGLTTPQIAQAIAQELQVSPEQVQVQVAEYRSQFLFLFGEIGDTEQIISYRGPETILECLQRIGGLTRDAVVTDVRVVRPHLEEGKPPEVFRIDLPAIVKRRELRTNIQLQPGDRIYIARTRQSEVACLMHPVFRWLVGLTRKPSGPGSSSQPPRSPSSNSPTVSTKPAVRMGCTAAPLIAP
jgi:protein involved in polysaccharide export with SLBB domain